MGDVYRAHDRERNVDVALKLLRNADPTALYRFKQEFRALTDLSHPNLVEFYELVAWQDQWFLTMEYIEGVPFLQYVREGLHPLEERDDQLSGSHRIPGAGPPQATARAGILADEVDDYEEDTAVTQTASYHRDLVTLSRPEQFERLRSALRQLVSGVAALHAAGHLHRDIKPSNLMVRVPRSQKSDAGAGAADEDEAQVAILDFGVMTQLAHRETEDDIVGTPAYMAPEQAAGAALTPGSDWYSVGVVLYEAITGRRPFGGSVRHSLEARARFDPQPPRVLVPRTPSDINQVCIALLARNPEERPSGSEVMRMLGGTPAHLPAAVGPRRGVPEALVGRELHLKALRAAFAEARRGASQTVLVRGAAGMGKTALVQRFVEELERTGDAVVLSGRCYEHESMPYKALDPLIDALCRYLLLLTREQVEAVLPEDTQVVARLFPVLRRVEPVAGLLGDTLEAIRPLELRRRAFAAMRMLVAGLARTRPLVLFIDDLQWGDADSAALLKEVIRPPQSGLLVVGCLRTEDQSSSPFLQALLPLPSVPVEITVEPLSLAETLVVVDKLLGGVSQVLPSIAKSIARESGGNPFFVHELVRYVQAETFSDMSLGTITLEEVIRVRLAELPDSARRLLEVIAVAGQPVSQAAARRAAALGGEASNAERLLQSRKLIRTRGGEGKSASALETYHDRIREVAVSLLDDRALGQLHYDLAMALSLEAEPDPESLADHFEGAGDLERAVHFCVRAAEQAAQALAFERAATLYQRALEMRDFSGPERSKLRAALARALGDAARGADAARVYLEAAEEASPADSLEYRRLAGEHLLRCGHIDQGVAIIEAVVREVGLHGPKSSFGILVAFLWRRARLRVRGLRFRQRDASELAPAQLRRLDVCWSAATGLGMVDQIRSSDFQTRHLLLALEAGEPYRVARALAVEAAFAALGGPRGRRRCQRVLDLSKSLTEGMGWPDVQGWHPTVDGLAAYQSGDFLATLRFCEEAERLLYTHGGSLSFELSSIQLVAIWALYYLGEIDEVQRRVPRHLREAEERADLYTATNLATGLCIMNWLARDDVAEARQVCEQAIGRWSTNGYHLQHYWAALARSHIALYSRDSTAARRLLGEDWAAYARSVVKRIQLVKVEAGSFIARCALLVGTVEGDEQMMRRAAKQARKLCKQDFPMAGPLGQLVEAGIAASRDRRAVAIELLTEAERGFEAARMALHVEVARLRRGQLMGGAEGDELVARGLAWMRDQSIEAPFAMADLIAPGFER